MAHIDDVRTHAQALAAMAKEGVKHDAGKLPWDLLPWDAVTVALAQAQGVDGAAVEPFIDVMREAGAWFERRNGNLMMAVAYVLGMHADGAIAALRDVVRVLDFGAKKYAARNWERGLSFSRVFAATARHMAALEMGEANDPETGLPHMAHAACELLFALAFVLRGRTDLDDRPNAPATVTGPAAPTFDAALFDHCAG